MTTLETQFTTAADQVKKLRTRPGNDTLLTLYSLYKQSTVGKCNTSKPWAFQLEAKAKWEAWNGLGNLSKTDAKTKYVKLVNGLLKKD